MLTVGPAFRVLTGCRCMPMLHQHKFVLVHSAASVRVLTIGYVGEPISQITDRPAGSPSPARKHAPHVLIVASPELGTAGGAATEPEPQPRILAYTTKPRSSPFIEKELDRIARDRSLLP